MKNKFTLIAILCCFEATAQVRGSFEQIYYYDEHGGFAMGPEAQLQIRKIGLQKQDTITKKRAQFHFTSGEYMNIKGVFHIQ